MEEVLITAERLATAADDVPSKMGNRAQALARAQDVLAQAQALVRTLQAAPDNAAQREQVAAMARSIRVDALAVGDEVDDELRVRDAAAAAVCHAHTLLSLVDVDGAAASLRSRAILNAVRRVGEAARLLQPAVAEGKVPKGKLLKVVPDVYRTLLDVVGLLCEDKLEKDAYCQMLHTAAMTAHADAVVAAASTTQEPMHRPAQGGKRKLGAKVRGRPADAGGANAPAQTPAPRRRGAAAVAAAGTRAGPRKRVSASQPARETARESVPLRRAASAVDPEDSPPLVRHKRPTPEHSDEEQAPDVDGRDGDDSDGDSGSGAASDAPGCSDADDADEDDEDEDGAGEQ